MHKRPACSLLLPQETPGKSRLSDSCPVSWLSCVLDNGYGLANHDGSQRILEAVSKGLSVSIYRLCSTPSLSVEQASTSQALFSAPWLAVRERSGALTVIPQSEA